MAVSLLAARYYTAPGLELIGDRFLLGWVHLHKAAVGYLMLKRRKAAYREESS
jgi:hypothetical protein